MITVGVKELKNQLSKYLQYVKKGEKVIITEHNKIVAEISTPTKGSSVSEVEKKLKQLEKDGKIILSKRDESYANMPESNDRIDWKTIYTETRKEKR
ncbi:MAG: type II toxin-antitoxin system prevent-host-death family antitoxin [Spirochaetaceae bacterium]|nr:type II toxin-antitoxin system prevent-host-death family antitoxin [Spirochaetaceae bacterium]